MRILVVGLGGIGQRHVRNLRTLLGEGADVIAWRVRRLTHVVTPTLRSDDRLDVEKTYNIRTFDNLQLALAEQPRVAFICNPTISHVPVARECVNAGCDVFLEKPVSNTLDGLAELIAETRERRRVVMVGYQLRFHPALLALQRALHQNSLGHLLTVRAHVGEYLPSWHPYEDYRQMYASRSELGGGVLVTQIHEFDYLYALFGQPRRVFAIGGHWSHLEIDVEDVASTLMEFQLAGRSLPVHLQQDYLQNPPSRGCEIVGDEGKIVLDLVSPSITQYDHKGKVAQSTRFETFERNELFVDELRHFLECVRTREKPIVDLNDGMSSLKMALAAKESIVKGRVVELAELCKFQSTCNA
jgi:predicted dehydrogenase